VKNETVGLKRGKEGRGIVRLV